MQQEEIYHNKLRRQQIRKELDDLVVQGETCETSQVQVFLESHQHEIELLRDVFSQFSLVSRDTFPFDVIWQYASNPSLETVLQQLANRELLEDLTRQRTLLANHLSGPLVIPVETTEQGPQFTAVTLTMVHFHLEAFLGYPLPALQINGHIPFLDRGDYPLLLDFSHDVTLPVTLRLEARPDLLPEDCRQDFQTVSPLIPPSTGSVISFLQEYLRKTSPNDVLLYGACLCDVLVTAYHYGYGRTSWVQELLHEWRSKRGEYSSLKGLSIIKETVQHIARTRAWRLPEEFASYAPNEEVMQELVIGWLARDPVLSQYDDFALEVEQLSQEEAIYTITIRWNGMLADKVEVSRVTMPLPQQPTTAQTIANNDREKQQIQNLETTLNKVLFVQSPSNNTAQHSLVFQEFHVFLKQLKREVVETSMSLPRSENLPSSLADLQAEGKKYSSWQERADLFLAFAHVYSEQNNELFARYALAESCFWRSEQHFNSNKKEARPYLRAFLLLLSQMTLERHHPFVRRQYQALAFYLSSYTFLIDLQGSTATDISDRFYSHLVTALSTIGKGTYEALGRCLVEIAAVNPRVMTDLINRMKTRNDTHTLQQILAPALQEKRVFRLDPFICLYLLARIDPCTIASAFTRQNLATAEERRRVVPALLKFANLPNAPEPAILLNGFAPSADSDTRIVLAFSLLVHPLVLEDPSKEGELKAALIAEALGLPSGITATEYFLGKTRDLALLFDRFLESQDPNVKGRYAISILDTIRLSRRRCIEHLRENLIDRTLRDNLNDGIVRFFRSVESYVTAEHAKLIHDTTLEIVLISDRTLHSHQQTRLTVEVRNVGEGIADHLVLEIFPVPGKYTVEERHRLHHIESLADKTPIQQEIFIQPLVDSNSNIELLLQLRYDALKKKNKVAELSTSKRTVWLYPESQFIRVQQPYNPGAPATTWFYGRKNQLEGMADHLRTGSDPDTSMIIYGLKRAGKTSVVKRFIEHTLQERGLQETHIPIYVDLLQHPRANAISSNGDFLYFLLEIIVRALARRQVTMPFNLLLAREKFQQQPLDAFDDSLNQILSILENQRLLLVLDEFSTLNEKVAPTKGEKVLTSQMFGFLSNTIQNTHQLTFIFTGTYMLLDMMRTHMYDLAKTCQPLMISFLDDASARLLIQEPLQHDPTNLSRGWLEYDLRVVDRIILLTHCHPYFIQYICMHLVSRMNELKYHRVNLNDLDVVVTDILTKPSHVPVMLNLWDEFVAPQHKVLSVIASLSNANQHGEVELNEIMNTFQNLGETHQLEEIRGICGSLVDAQLLKDVTSPSEQSESYQITIPLYQMWLKQNKSPRTVFGKHSIESPSY